MPWGAAAAAVAGGVVAHNNQPDDNGPVGRAEEFKFNSGLFKTEFDHRDGQDFIRADPKGPLRKIMNREQRAADKFFKMARNNKDANLANQLGGEFLEGLSAFDPMEIAQMQFNQFNPILQDQFDQDRLDLEQRQFSQGRLGSTGGSQDFNALFDSQDDSRRQLLFDSFGQGLAAQQQQFGMAQGLLTLDPQLRGLFQGLGSNSLSNLFNIQNAALNQLQVGASISGGGAGGDTGFNAAHTIGAGLLNSGVNGLGDGLNGMFTDNGQQTTTFNQGSAFDQNNSFGGGR